MMRTLLLVALLAVPTTATAGTAIGESIWDKQNAIDRATMSLPAGAQVTSTDCQSVEVGTGNYHYLCRLTFTDPPSGSAAPAAAP